MERHFEVGDWVFLRLKPFKQQSIRLRKVGKLVPKFFGPFQVLQKIGPIAYKLDLPLTSCIHPVFHISCLKAKFGQHINPIPTLPPVDSQGHLSPEPTAILQQRPVQLRKHRQATEVLVHWEGSSPNDATWELLHKLQQQYPHLVARFFKRGG